MWKDKTIHLFSLGFLGTCPSGSGGLWFGNKPETEKDVRIFCSVSLLLLHSEVTLHLISQATAQQKLKYIRKGILSSVTAEPAPQPEKMEVGLGIGKKYTPKTLSLGLITEAFTEDTGHWCLIRFHLQNGNLTTKILSPFNLDTTQVPGTKISTILLTVSTWEK